MSSQQLKTQAIQTALTGDWDNAILLNEQILKDDPDDIATLNRIGFAHLSLGNIKDARNVYEKVLSLDMKNPIALRNIKRLNGGNILKTNIQLNNLFIEETGKTKIIELVNIADKKVVSHLRSGEKISIRIKRNKIFALDSDEKFLGMLPDDVCKRLTEFMNGGNIYDAYIWASNESKISIFIREIKRAKKYTNQPSFVSNEKTKLSIEKTHPTTDHL
ncbi:MAG TPA: tetratricopeptide repeat protein [Candidatus Limnocylindrales bacterium]|nr:tetratricopeptide repeat protein [Candidatus Limnocylindrales bacterium]